MFIFTRLVLRSRKGSGMTLALFAIMILFAFGISFLSVAFSSLIAAKKDYLRERALSVAEAGVDWAICYLRVESNPDLSGSIWYTGDMGAGESFRVCLRSDSSGDTTRIFITSISTVTEGGSTASRTLKVLVAKVAENVCPWNNVIFGGVGQSGRSINGNVVMRGSIHLLGDGEDFTDVDGDSRWDDDEPYIDSNANGQYDEGETYTDVDGDDHRDAREPFDDVNGNGTRDPALTVTDMASEISGDANMGNNYSGMPVLLQSKIPAAPTTIFGGETVESLAAKLRVKHGRVNISGSASVGTPNVTENSLKETINGAYVSDGYGGNKGSTQVYSDNGCSHGYDLGDDLVSFPALTDPYPPYGNYQQYLRANALVIDGDTSLTPGTPYSASSELGSISYDGNGLLEINGIVFIEGNLNLNYSSSVPTLTYRGKGSIVTTEDIYIHTNVLPETNFPRTDALGLIASHNMWIATGPGDAQLTMAMAMYAQYKTRIGKQCKIAGTAVCSFFEMINVPHIYQVPELTDNLPPGMPGGDPIWIISIDILSWEDVIGSST